MSFIIQTATREGPLYAQTVGKTRVKWTPDREKARRYRNYATAAKAVQAISFYASVKDNDVSRDDQSRADWASVAPDTP